jgi:hypothetical protein
MDPPQAGQGRRDVISQFFGIMTQAHCRRGSGDKMRGKFAAQIRQRPVAHFGRMRDFLLRALAASGRGHTDCNCAMCENEVVLPSRTSEAYAVIRNLTPITC